MRELLRVKRIKSKFRRGMLRSVKQYNAGEVESFDNVDDFLSDLKRPE
jgi:hypothetical protein